MRALWRPIVTVIGVLLILTYLLVRIATVDPALHQRILTALHELEINDAELNQDLLR